MELIILFALALGAASLFARFHVNQSKYELASSLPELPFQPNKKIDHYLWFSDTEFAIPLLVKGEPKIVKKQKISEAVRYEIYENGKLQGGGTFGEKRIPAIGVQEPNGKKKYYVSSLGLKLYFSTKNPSEVTLEFMKKPGKTDTEFYRQACSSLKESIETFQERQKKELEVLKENIGKESGGRFLSVQAERI